jgi:hypothetical protein
MKQGFRIFALALLLVAGYAAPASAIQDVSITQYFDPSTSEGFFEVTNNSTSSTLHYFAVANNSVDSVSAYSGWVPAIITRTQWENNTFSLGLTTYQLDTSNFDWVKSFGATATLVAAYASDIGLAQGGCGCQFEFFSSVPSSRFVAFDQSGAVMASGVTSDVIAVPEASNAAMFGVGVLMLALVVGRRRKGTQGLFAA